MLLDTRIFKFDLEDSNHQIVPIRFFHRQAKLIAVEAIEPEGAEERALRSTVTFHQQERRPIVPSGAGGGGSLHDVGLHTSAHVTASNIGRS